jgi:hypothetical protein
MKLEHPILFCGSMIREIQEGRKTMTRRVITPQPKPLGDDGRRTSYSWRGGLYALRFYPDRSDILEHCPYGRVGGRLWVRETFVTTKEGEPIYRADPMFDGMGPGDFAWSWRPSIYMPRKLSRILLEIEEERVEQVQDITDADAEREGVDRTNASIPGYCRERFRKLWDSINSDRGFGWGTNPWVWVLGIRRIEA